MDEKTTPQTNLEMHKSSSVMVGVIAAIVGLAIGFGACKAMSGSMMAKNNDQAMTANNTTNATAKSSDMAMMPMTDTKAADLRVLLNGLEKEHVNLAAAAVRAGFDGQPDFKAAAGQLDVNSHAIADAVGSVYGAEAGSKFYTIWASHIGFFVNYTVAAKNGDKAGMDKAVKDLMGYVDAISDFLSTANPNLPRDAVHQLVMDHVLLLKGAVDAYGAGDFAGSFSKQHDANEQIGKIADALSGAIVKQYPDKFK